MKRLNSKKGITLIELIGAIAILSLVLGLVATTIGIFIRNANTSVASGNTQTEGLLLVRNIENNIIDLRPNGYSSCDSITLSGITETSCIVLERRNLDGDVLRSVKFELEGETIQLSFDSEESPSRVLDNLTLSESSTIIFERTALNRLVLTFRFHLEDVDTIFQASSTINLLSSQE